MAWRFLLTYSIYIGLLYVFWTLGFGNWIGSGSVNLLTVSTTTPTQTGVNITNGTTNVTTTSTINQSDVIGNAFAFFSFITYQNAFNELWWWGWFNSSLSIIALYIVIKDLIIPLIHAIGQYIPFT